MQLQELTEGIQLIVQGEEAEDIAAALLVAGRGLRMAAGLTASLEQRRELCEQAARMDALAVELRELFDCKGLLDLQDLVSAPWPRGFDVSLPDV